MVSYWLICDSVSLAECLLGKKRTSFFFLLGSSLVVRHESFWSPNSIWLKLLFNTFLLGEQSEKIQNYWQSRETIHFRVRYVFIPYPVRWMNRTSYRASVQLSFLICKIGTAVSETKGDSFKASSFIWEKAMVPHSGILAWKIPRMESLQSMGSLSRTRLSDFTFTP